MTIGMNETLNKLSGGIDTEKLVKKDEFTTQDFSSISKQFTNIFNNQFDKQFQSQFDYKKMFTNGSNTNDFISNTASKMSDEKYYSQSFNTNINEQMQRFEPSKPASEKNSESSKNTSEKNSKTEEKKQSSNDIENSGQAKVQSESGNSEKLKELKENIQEATAEAQVLLMMGNIQKVQHENPEKFSKNEKESKTSGVKSEKVDTKENKTLVSVKATELENLTKLLADDTLTPKVDVQLKDVKIEKLDVKIKPQAVKQDKENAQMSADANKKVETTPKEDIQNKVSLERLTANVVSEHPESVNELDKLLNKDIIKKVDTSAKHAAASDEKADGKIQANSQNAFLNNQGFNQNLGQSFGQANQDAQSQLKANILASNMTSNSPLAKNDIQMSSFAQPSQANNVLERNIFDQVMKNIQGNISANKSEVTMILKPENLGKVTLNIMNERGTVSAEFKAETKEAVDALNKNIQDLKETLKQQGVICSNLVVKLEEPNRSENNPQFAQQEQNFKDFSQGNSQNSDKESFENKSNNQTTTVENEFNQDVQEEQAQPNQAAKDQGLIDYRV